MDPADAARVVHVAIRTGLPRRPDVIREWFETVRNWRRPRLWGAAGVIPIPEGSRLEMVALDQCIINAGNHYSVNSQRMNAARSYVAAGTIYPVILLLRWDNRYAIADGQHRCYAAREAGLTHIQAWVSIAPPEKP